jgi:hypothetical protein
MTTFTAPPNQFDLVLGIGSGDVLDVNSGGIAAFTDVGPGSKVVVSGGDAVDTTLYGGIENVESGTADGVTFAASGSELDVSNPTSLQGVLTFEPFDGEVTLDFTFGVTSVKETSDTLTLTYGLNHQTVTYLYKTADGGSVHFLYAGDGEVEARVTAADVSGHYEACPPRRAHNLEETHIPPPIVGSLHHTLDGFHLH